MPLPFTTSTRRGLVLILYGEAVLVAGALAFVALPNRPGLLVGGIVLSLFLGAPAGWVLMTGRREFGPAHARSIRRAAWAFAGLVALLVMAYFQVTDVVPTTLNVTDLRAPWILLGIVLGLDALAMGFLLWHLAGETGRRWLVANALVAMAATVAYVSITAGALQDLIVRSGGVAVTPEEAASYARDFVHTVVRAWAAALLTLRVTFLPALYTAISNVAEAEVEAAATPRHGGA